MSRAYGTARAIQDRERLRRRTMEATDAEFDSQWWRWKGYFLAFWLGLTAPMLFTPAGRAYDAEARRDRWSPR